MAKSARELFEEAMRLDPAERATLDAGEVQAVPGEELRARLYQR